MLPGFSLVHDDDDSVEIGTQFQIFSCDVHSMIGGKTSLGFILALGHSLSLSYPDVEVSPGQQGKTHAVVTDLHCKAVKRQIWTT